MRDDLLIDRSGDESPARRAAMYVYVWKATVADHERAHHVVFALKQFDVRRKVLSDQIVVVELNDRHLIMRINFARADAGKMFGTAEQARALQAAQVNHRVAKYLAGRAPVGARIESVREQVAVVGHDGHDRREVHVEAEHAQDFAGDLTEHARGGQVADRKSVV